MPAEEGEKRRRVVPERPCPPTSPEEKETQIRSILNAIEHLREIQSRGEFIARAEVEQLREAFTFATGGQPSRPSAGVETPHEEVTSIAEMTAHRLLIALEHYATSRAASFAQNPRSGGGFGYVYATLRDGWMLLIEMAVVSVFNFFLAGSLALLATGFFLYGRYTAPWMLAYLIYIFTKGRPRFPVAKRMGFARARIWRYYRDYFPTRCIIPATVRSRFDPARNYFFLYHPHGVVSFGAVVNFALDVNRASEALPGIQIHLQTLRFNFFIPFFRAALLATGAGDASATTIRQTLRAGAGESVMVVLGGSEEAVVSRPCTNDLILRKRAGFVRIALQEGVPLVPVYGFGENDVFEHAEIADAPVIKRVVAGVKRFTGVAIPMLKGARFLPRRRPITVVVGEPLELPKIEAPTDAEIDFWRERYIDALQNLYETYRVVYDLKSTGLRVVM
ncbi:unnamed protein product [Phytomonas sp. EM1]|nr:unnamed protein product [Phytomonas sp. EM1]|eukprot:CCW64362.1 unnamed protein product [Phytomonas sp. isolate EM1]